MRDICIVIKWTAVSDTWGRFFVRVERRFLGEHDRRPSGGGVDNCTDGSTRVGTLVVATVYCVQLIQNRYMFRSFTVLHCSHQHCVQPVASDVEVVGYL